MPSFKRRAAIRAGQNRAVGVMFMLATLGDAVKKA
jgi:hypothetical protein